MDTQKIFEYATRNKLRFASSRGELTTEQLWDVPLRSGDDFNLGLIAKVANRAYKEVAEETFVDATRTAVHVRREAALEVVKQVIAVKLADEARAARAADARKEKAKLLEILAEKQDGKLSELSERELKKRIADLDEVG